MNGELCTIKGTRDGLVINIADVSQFSEVLSSLERQLWRPRAFSGAVQPRFTYTREC